MSEQAPKTPEAAGEIALIGMAGRFPGAATVEELWRNLCDGVDSIHRFTREELEAAGVPAEVAADPAYVPAAGVLERIEDFDARFFGFSPREAEILDPQDRLFLECSWEAMEDAGYDPARVKGPVGVYGGEFLDTYLFRHLYANPAYMADADPLLVRVLNDKDFLTTLVSYKLNLRGPSVAVQTACSTSLVAVHLACEALLSFQCDLALAGGVSITVPHRVGYRYREGSIFSPDGRCRPFSAEARGTVGGNGAGVVVLKRLAEALEDGDHVYAVVRGTSINNDGSLKAGYTAPSVDGQAEVVAAAQGVAGIDPATISYIEAHGTGTEVGDPIEVAALQQVFGATTENRGFCGLGSLKSNLGHLEAAAGVAGLIKTALAIEHRTLPASLHCTPPNPALKLEDTAFSLVSETRPWTNGSGPRRAGVSSFGVGGTNAHVVLEEAPVPPREQDEPLPQLLTLSAATSTALAAVAQRLAARLESSDNGSVPPPRLADAAFTLQVGRQRLRHRGCLVCESRSEAVTALRRFAEVVAERPVAAAPEGERPVVFLFPGQGAQYPGMGRELYDREPVFRREVDRCAEVLDPLLGQDLRRLLWPDTADSDPEAEARLERTALAQPALFTIEWALARTWMAWGVRPAAMVGHSLGEYAAAAVAGVFSLEVGLRLVAERGRLMEAAPEGAMLTVDLPEAEALALAREAGAAELVVAAVNAPALTVLSGPGDAVDRLVAHLGDRDRAGPAQGVEHRRLHTSHAFHSPAMEAVRKPLERHLAALRPAAPCIPYLSNLTGEWIGEQEAADPEYWLRHLLSPVLFARSLEAVLKDPDAVLLEVGPGESLSRLVRQQPGWRAARPLATSLPHPRRPRPAGRHLLEAVGRLWEAGVDIDWQGFHGDRPRRRVPLPSYPFERQRYWVEAPSPAGMPQPGPAAAVSEPAAVTAESPVPEEGVEARPAWMPPYVEPRSEDEAAVAETFGAVLAVPGVGAEDDFFELGGHSLLATQVVARLRQRLGVALPLADLHAAPTPALLADRLAQRRAAPGEARAVDAGKKPSLVPDPEAAHRPFPLTDVQEAYWVGRSGAFELGEVATHWYIEVEERGLAVGRFEAAWRQLIARHDALRTVILEDGRQRILPAPAPWGLPVVDAAAVEAAAAERVAESVRRRMSHQVLDAATWPLFDLRATLLPAGRVRIHFSLDLLIADAWSFVLLTRELAHFYHHPGAALPPPGVTFRDYVVAERGLRRSEEYLASLDYWRRRLSVLPPAPELPLAHRPEELGRPRFERRTAALEQPLWTGLKRGARQRGITPSGIVLAVLAEVLAAWCKSPRFTLNLTLFNRLPLHPDIDSVVGDFTSLTLLAVEAAGGTFEERARRLQARLWQDLDHRQVSGVTVIRELARLSGGTHRARMPVVFTSTLGLESGEAEVDGLPGEVVYSISQTPQVWIDVQVRERGGALRFNWDAVEELFPAGLLDTLFGTFCRLLERLGGDDANWQRRSFQLVPEEQLEERRLVNATEGPFPQALLHEPFLERARRDPDRVAVVSSRGEHTYGEVEALSHALVRALHRHEVRPGELVAVVLPKGWRQVVAVLGIGRAGAAYLPIDPSLPTERINWLLHRGEVRVAVTGGDGTEAAAGWPPSVRCLGIEEGVPEGSPEPPPCEAEPGHLAYVIFTSGSSGSPKGVMMEHAAVLNTLVDVNRRFSVGPEDRVLALSSLSFDLSVYDVFGLLAAGGAVVLPAEEHRREPARWQALLESAGVTVWNSVPALLGMLVEHLEERGRRLPPRLRLILLSGDWIPTDLPARVRALSDNPDLRLVSLGGATEAAVWSILHPIEEVDPAWTSIPYGHPMTNQRFLVLNEVLDECPEWVPGLLCIAGRGLARGYWRDPERTNASFFRHPGTGERLYATGDLGRWRPGGWIEFLGREDGQVKIGGYRIEVGEVEAAVAAHPTVTAAAVVAVGELRGSRRLVAHVVLEGGKRDDPQAAEALRGFVAVRLPEYMIPAAFVLREALPLSVNGKLDRKALAAEAAAPPQQEPKAVAPRNSLERAVAQIWAEVLEREAVGVLENFFELGGDSVLATRITARVAATLGVEVPLRALFSSPTVAGLAAALAERGPETAGVLAEPIARREAGPQGVSAAPLSFQQQRMWFLQQLDPDSPIYHLPRALRLEGGLQVAALEEALGILEARQEALRTRFESESRGGVRQAFAPCALHPLPVTDLSGLGLGPGPVVAAAEALVQEAVDRPFDLQRGPLWRRHLVRLGEQEHILVLSFHHLIGDGWSLGVVSRWLEAAYPALCRGEVPSPPDLPVQYGDYTVWQRERLTADWLEERMAFWRQYLEAAPRHLELPTDRPRPAAQTYRGAGVAFTLPPQVTAAVTALARKREGTPFLVLAAVFTALLGRLSAQDDVVVGTPVANRNRPELEPLLGLFVNTVVLRARAAGASFAAYFDAFKETSLLALSHQEMPFERLVDELAPQRDVRRTPIFQALFVHQSVLREMERLGSLRVSRVPFRAETAMFDLSLTLAETAAGTAGWLEYNRDLFDTSTARRWAAAYARLVAAATADPATPLAALPWLSAAQRQQVRWEWSATAPALETAPVHELVAHRARRQPDAPALEAEGIALTYGQLMEWVGALGRRLRRLGVGPEDRIGLALERGAAAVVAMLAVLRAGAAYVPMDPADPAARRSEVARDAGLRWVLGSPGEAPPVAGVTLVPVAGTGEVDDGGVPEEGGEPGSVDPHSLAYVIYTSGSTGRPKGVLVPHGTLARHTASAAARFGIGPGDRVLQFASLAFDASAEEIFPCLTRGATLVVRSAAPPGPPAQLFAELAAASISVLDLPTSYWQLAAAALARGEAALPASLRLVILGGERASGEAAAAWVRAAARAGREDLRTINTYGPTEATIVATRGALPAAYRPGEVPLDPDLGRPIAGTRAFVADPAGCLAAPGVVGELLLGGGGVTRGYLDRPGLTAERFLPDPWSGEAGARLYTTGDLVRWLGDGRIAFVGRADFQVKVRGFRVEPGEIEARLRALPEVAEAVVVSRRLEAGHDDLVAYLQPEGGVRLSVPRVRRALAAQLPAWMMPGAFAVRETLPRTAGGKVDVRRLPAPDRQRGEQEAAYAPPVTPAEVTVAAAWRAVLGLDRVGLHDNFFDLGGNSMLLVHVYEALRRRCDRPLLLIDLLESPTVQAQARRLAEPPAVPTPEPAVEERDRAAELRQGRQRLLARRRRR